MYTYQGCWRRRECRAARAAARGAARRLDIEKMTRRRARRACRGTRHGAAFWLVYAKTTPKKRFFLCQNTDISWFFDDFW